MADPRSAVDGELAEFAAARWPALLRFGLLLTGNAADAEDLVQTALTRTAVRWRSLESIEQPEAYVRTAMARLHINRWRGLLSRERLTADPPDSIAPVDAIEEATDRDAMWAALRTLPPRQRAVLVLRYYADLSEQDIAQALRISPGTVKSQAAKALSKLRVTLESADAEPAAGVRDQPRSPAGERTVSVPADEPVTGRTP